MTRPCLGRERRGSPCGFLTRKIEYLFLADVFSALQPHQSPELPVENLIELPVARLQDLCKAHHLPSTGLKVCLVRIFVTERFS